VADQFRHEHAVGDVGDQRGGSDRTGGEMDVAGRDMRRAAAAARGWPAAGDVNPFVRYRALLASHALALETGVGDDAFLALARGLDEAVAAVEGRGFEVTPFGLAPGLARLAGLGDADVWVKDETGSVAGSHKARHLAGLMLYLQAREAAGAVDTRGRRLAIASCGNAALAAAVVARAAGRGLDVFVPPSAERAVLDRLGRLSAAIHVCGRAPGAPGDPCYAAFRAAVERGAVPFCCQGSDNGLTIDGARTIAWEMVSATAGAGGSSLDAVVVQVGGGALASAVAAGFEDARRCGAIHEVPRFYTVQTEGAYPLERAYAAVAERIVRRARGAAGRAPGPTLAEELAELAAARPDVIDDELAFARRHRSLFMRPWPEPPRSVARGILDDETYDWAAVVEAMLRTGGWPIVVGEDLLVEANRAAREATGIDVDHTGSAGLAGLMRAVAVDARLAAGRVAVLFTGAARRPDPPA
jgi:threonine dehydratase